MKKRAHVFYSGRVQGVGFRLTAEEAARPAGIHGWIKNLRDGRVELVAEAEEEKVKQFLEELRTGPMKNFIKDVNVTWGPASDIFKDFETRYN